MLVLLQQVWATDADVPRMIADRLDQYFRFEWLGIGKAFDIGIRGERRKSPARREPPKVRLHPSRDQARNGGMHWHVPRQFGANQLDL